MGLYLYLSLSKSITTEEWKEIYPKTLILAEKFQLADFEKLNIRNNSVNCLVPTKEKEFMYGLFSEKKTIGWNTIGDYKSLRFAEDFFVPKYLQNEPIEPDAGDAIMGALPGCLNKSWEDPEFNHVYHLWGSKTQAENYRIYLLAIACFITTKLKEKAFVYGNISYKSCKNAVELANKYLNEKVLMPDQCIRERFEERIDKLPLTKEEKEIAFNEYYIGEDAEEVDVDLLFMEYYEPPKDYDIYDSSLLKYYKKGDTVSPEIEDALVKFRELSEQVFKEPKFLSLTNKIVDEKIELVLQSYPDILLRDCDWEKICKDIEEHPESFARYYSISRICMNTSGIKNICIALIINDDVYEYSKELKNKQLSNGLE